MANKRTKAGDAGGTMDARWLAMFMICSTQDTWADYQLTPEQGGSEPDYDNSPATQMGIDSKFQQTFYYALGPNFQQTIARYNRGRKPLDRYKPIKSVRDDGTMADMTPLEVFQSAVDMLKLADPAYKPPACPDPQTIQAAVVMLNIFSRLSGN